MSSHRCALGAWQTVDYDVSLLQNVASYTLTRQEDGYYLVHGISVSIVTKQLLRSLIVSHLHKHSNLLNHIEDKVLRQWDNTWGDQR